MQMNAQADGREPRERAQYFHRKSCNRYAGDQHRPSASTIIDNASAGPEILLACGVALGASNRRRGMRR